MVLKGKAEVALKRSKELSCVNQSNVRTAEYRIFLRASENGEMQKFIEQRVGKYNKQCLVY